MNSNKFTIDSTQSNFESMVDEEKKVDSKKVPDNLFKIQNTFDFMMIEESIRMQEEEEASKFISENLIRLLNINFENASTLFRSKKSLYFGKFVINVKMNYQNFTFSFSALVRNHNDESPCIKRCVNDIEAHELIDAIENGKVELEILDIFEATALGKY